MIPAPPMDAGWTEAVVIVADLDDRARSLTAALGWRVLARARTTAATLAAWGLPSVARGEEALIGEPGAARGWLRLVQLRGVEAAGRARSSAQPWEPGGWAGVNVRVADIAAAHAQLQRAGFQGFSDPVGFDVPPFRVREAMLAGPDGLVIGLLQRVSPPLTGWSQAAPFSRGVTIFGAAADPAAQTAVLQRAGLQPGLSYDGPLAPPGPNLFALPHNVTPGLTRTVQWMGGQGGGEEGRIATLGFRGLVGRDFTASAAPPRLGLSIVRVALSDAPARCAALPGARPYRSRLAPWGRVAGCVAAMPAGGILDLFTPDQRP